MNTEFLTWQFGVATIAIVGVMRQVSSALWSAAPSLRKKGWVKSLMNLGCLALGFLPALPADFLMGDTYGQRAMTGIACSTVSIIGYNTILKRIRWFAGGEKNAPDPAQAS